MKNSQSYIKRSSLLLLLALAVKGQAQYMWQISKDTVACWTYNWGDEFNETQMDDQKWLYWYGWGRNIYGNKEQQYYSTWQNHELRNGELTLNAKKQQVTEKMVDWLPDNDSIFFNNRFMGLNKRTFNYTAGMLQSHKEMVYGYFEIKFTMSYVKGYWPAFWMAGGTPNEEIDFFELKTDKKNKIHVGRHSTKAEENYLPYFLFKKKLWGDWIKFKGDLTRGYNIISGEWNKDYVKYYLNGECIAYTKVHLEVPKRIVANIAVPGDDGPFHPGPPKDDTAHAEMKIDYIRVWSADAACHAKEVSMLPADKISSERKIEHSSLISKTKFLYGSRSVHENEGITASLIPTVDNKYILTVTGKNIPDDASFSLYAEDGKKISYGRLLYGENQIDLNTFSAKKIRFEIEAYGKKATCLLTRSDR